MDDGENGKSEQPQKHEGRGKLWQSLGKSMPIVWVVIVVLLFAVLILYWAYDKIVGIDNVKLG